MMSSQGSKTLFDSQLARKCRRMVSTGFNSGVRDAAEDFVQMLPHRLDVGTGHDQGGADAARPADGPNG